MASSSSKASTKWIYDVFLSFRGEDTCKNFVSHFYKALRQDGIYTFKDDEKLERGKSISPELLEAIKSSRFSIIIISKNYAFSSWCLEELVTIFECMDKMGQLVVPVFYNVDPSHVRTQQGTFAEAFAKHEKRYMGNMEVVHKWREALTRVANISGWHSKEWNESTLIEQIVKYILKKLVHTISNDDSGLIGMDKRTRQLRCFLDIGSEKVCFIGIWGMGGIGKTTIASAIYGRIACDFEACCFLENVREESNHNIVHLQKQLLSRILKTKIDDVEDLDSFSLKTFHKRRLQNLRVLIVLDDVDDEKQLNLLAGGHDWFGGGSRIIITTRNKEVLVGRVDEIYEKRGLTNQESLTLFSLHAFKQTNPFESFEELSHMVISFTGGNPLALRVLGSFLRYKTKKVWEVALKRLKLVPHVEIFDVLKISFDGLDEEEKDVFLHVACFLKGKDTDIAMKILESCGYSPEASFTNLIDHYCLMDYSFSKLCMHDLIQEMGWEVVRRQSVKESGKRSRLWLYEDVFYVLGTNTGTQKIEGMAVDSEDVKNVCINHSSFSNMHGVRLLMFVNINIFQDSCKNLETLPSALNYMHWQAYPFDCLPPGHYIKNVVVIDMPQSHIKQLWMGTQCRVNLKVLNLRYSKCLRSIPDLSRAANFESLILNDCTRLVEVHFSIGHISKLKILDMKGCRELQSFPARISTQYLEIFTLSGCQKLEKFPEISCKIEHLLMLPLDDTDIEEMPSSIENLKGLVTLSMKNCRMIKHLPDNICNLRHLKALDLSGCSKLENLPENIGNIKSLETLDVSGSAITEVSSSVANLSNLRALSMAECKRMKACSLNLPSHSLRHLNLSDCNLMDIPSAIDRLSNLRVLSLRGNNFRSIPESIKQLFSLEHLNLARCKKLQSLPLLPPGVKRVNAASCTSLERISQQLIDNPTRVEFESGQTKRLEFFLWNCPSLAWYAQGSFMLGAVKNFHLMQAQFHGDQVRSCGVHLIDGHHGSDIRHLFATTSFGSSVETADIPSLSEDSIMLSGSKIKRPRDDPSCRNVEMSRNGSYDEEQPAKRSKELNLSSGLGVVPHGSDPGDKMNKEAQLPMETEVEAQTADESFIPIAQERKGRARAPPAWMKDYI